MLYFFKKYSCFQKIVLCILVVINALFLGQITYYLFNLWNLSQCHTSEVFQKQFDTLLCLYSVFISVFLLLEFIIVKSFPALSYRRWAKYIAGDSYIWKVRIDRLLNKEPEVESIETVLENTNKKIVGWINPCKLFLYTIIHFGFFAFVKWWMIPNKWFLSQTLLTIIGYLVIPISLGITMFSIITNDVVFDPQKPL